MGEVEEELTCFFKICVSTIVSVSYCYYVSPKIKPGVFRLLSVLPICALFFVHPLFLSSAHLTFITSSFTIHAIFKLILLAFDTGPLIPLPPNLIQFLCFTSFPIHPKQKQESQNFLPKVLYAAKVVVFGVVLHIFNHRQNMPPIILLGLYPSYIYLALEVLLTLLRVVVTITFGCQSEPIFNEPYLATSLQDFWGRRWNLTVSALLRWSVYGPVRRLCKNSEWSVMVGVLASFLVAGLSHEMLFFHINREAPTGQFTWFFVFHGVCLVAEGAVKKMARARGWVAIPVVSQLLTLGFIIMTSGWLFFPLFKRSGMMDRFANEYVLLLDYVKRQLYM
ncbi:unnamed protein product [Eruca vesicaria subsp. sativa]|uniref:Wax synthase domain-containing protein n=1 Tax=Eruca vesicaria subsp. sativa TaxID=29727 RepID=A0ABC8JLE2_ERUVS|nr:unnamed protein product [Eruca vesicaria subsp. sativa]